MMRTDDRERKGGEAGKGRRVTGTDQGQSYTEKYICDIMGVSEVRVIE